MGRLLGFLVIVAAALAGVWFFMPGGKDMLLDAKGKAMSALPSGDQVEDAADDAADAVDEAAEDTAEAVEETVEAVEEATDGEQPQ